MSVKSSWSVIQFNAEVSVSNFFYIIYWWEWAIEVTHCCCISPCLSLILKCCFIRCFNLFIHVLLNYCILLQICDFGLFRYTYTILVFKVIFFLVLNICHTDDGFLSICKQRKVVQRELLMFGHRCKADWLCYMYYFKKQSTCFKNSSIAICFNFYQMCLIFLSELIKVLFLIFLIDLFSFHTSCIDTNTMCG